MPITEKEIADALNNWSKEEMKFSAKELEQSITVRQAKQIEKGEIRIGSSGQMKGAAHRVRIGQELRLLRAILKKLSGS
jgi:hypothetical protein